MGFGKVFYAVNIGLFDQFALFAVVDVGASNGGGDRDEDEPISGGEFWAFAEPRYGNTCVLEGSAEAR